MALDNVIYHRKTRRLARLLGIDECLAMGPLESLWFVARKHAPTGAFERMTNQDIADEMRWSGDPNQLIDALLEAGWLDRVKGRLVVHDWHEHADDTTHAKLFRKVELFWNGVMPRAGAKCGPKEREPILEKYRIKYARPADNLFEQEQVLAQTRRDVIQQMEEAAPNVIPFVRDPAGPGGSPPEPEPEPEPEPVPEPAPQRTMATLTGICREIVCAYPASVAVGMTALEVPKEQVAQAEAAVLHEAKKLDRDPALSAEYILAQTRAFAAAVAQWPPGEQRFVPKLRNWLAEYQYRRSEEEWRRGTGRQRDGTHGSGGSGGRPSSAERWNAGEDAFATVYADLVPARTG